MTVLQELKKWLKTPGNSEAKLAVMLGYRDGAAIKAWVRRKRVPNARMDQVQKIIEKGVRK